MCTLVKSTDCQGIEISDNTLKKIILKVDDKNKLWCSIINDVVNKVKKDDTIDETKKLTTIYEILKPIKNKLILDERIEGMFDTYLFEIVTIVKEIADYNDPQEIELKQDLKDNLLEALDNKDIGEYYVFVNLTKIGVQIVETYPDLKGFEKKMMLKEVLSDIIDERESIENISKDAIEPIIEAIVSAWNAPSPKIIKWCCWRC